ncbi:hypothetical protein M3Y98_00349300 [Aphelenchoides besseyi]|nr:hypothetical protein M3Y98_00349300 [Aphelenchoides besseyi]KAI6201608.1 hypothetical protein M3Y96_00860400 [Aphelenchoides besseyi]
MPGIHPFRNKDKMTIRKMKRVDVPQVPELHGMSEIVSRRSRHFSSGSYSSSNALPTEHGAMELKSFCHSSSASSSRAPSCCADHSDFATNGDPRHSIGVGSAMSTSSRNYGTLTTFQSKINSASYVPIQLSHNRNSTSSSSSSSGIESLKALSQVATSNSSTSFNSTSFISDDSPTNCPDRMQKSSPYASSQSSHRHSSAGSDTSSRPRSQCAHFNSLPCNIGEMIAQGIPDAEIISNWLEGLGMQQYLSLFITQGYDVASVARLTSEDLLALGITDPKNRRKVHANIQEWNVVDNWPTAVQPTDSAAFWLIAIGLQQYVRLFESEGYCLMEDLQNISFEDLEDMGIKKLGHIKRICLALKKIKLARNQSSVVSPPAFTNSRSNNSQFHSPDSGYTDISNNSILTNQRPRLSSQIYESRRSMLQPSNETDYSTYKNTSFRSDSSDSYNMPKLRIYTTQEILSATSDLPRSVNGDVMTIPTLDFDYDLHRSRVHVPPPAPVPQSARPDLSFDFVSDEINVRNDSSLHGSPHQTIRSGTFRSQPSTPARHLGSFISNGRDPELVLDELNSDLRTMNPYK